MAQQWSAINRYAMAETKQASQAATVESFGMFHFVAFLFEIVIKVLVVRFGRNWARRW